MSLVSDFLTWLSDTWYGVTNFARVRDQLVNARSVEEIERVWDSLTPQEKNIPTIKDVYEGQKKSQGAWDFLTGDPVKALVSDALDQWLEVIKKYEKMTPEQAPERLKELTADTMKIAATISTVEIAASKLPWMNGEVIAGMTRRTATWLGFGAVISAIAHDPVKIGILRPYQDTLEQTFRNKRPDDNMTFQAYRTRELAPEKVDDVDKLTEADMKRIEADNDRVFAQEMSRHGYTDEYIRALGFSATRTPGFNDMMQLARQGLLTRGLAIYSLWGYGYDKLTMKPLLDALMEQNRRGSYEGFRSMIEPAYREGVISEEDLRTYWTRISVPAEVQEWVIPRLRKQREQYMLKASGGTAQKERDLTVSQIQQAYEVMLLDRAKAQNMILGLGYAKEEADILLTIAEMRRKLPGAAKLKRLPLSDYEKAYKNNLIGLDDVLARMQGEYLPEDIALERSLLESGKA